MPAFLLPEGQHLDDPTGEFFNAVCGQHAMYFFEKTVALRLLDTPVPAPSLADAPTTKVTSTDSVDYTFGSFSDSDDEDPRDRSVVLPQMLSKLPADHPSNVPRSFPTASNTSVPTTYVPPEVKRSKTSRRSDDFVTFSDQYDEELVTLANSKWTAEQERRMQSIRTYHDNLQVRATTLAGVDYQQRDVDAIFETLRGQTQRVEGLSIGISGPMRDFLRDARWPPGFRYGPDMGFPNRLRHDMDKRLKQLRMVLKAANSLAVRIQQALRQAIEDDDIPPDLIDDNTDDDEPGPFPPTSSTFRHSATSSMPPASASSQFPANSTRSSGNTSDMGVDDLSTAHSRSHTQSRPATGPHVNTPGSDTSFVSPSSMLHSRLQLLPSG
jgi:hypothetical protein